MTSLFERLDTEEAIVRAELSSLRQKIATVEERPAHLAITQETLLSLTGHADQADDSTEPQPQEQGPGYGGDLVDGSVPRAAPGDVTNPRDPSVTSGPLELSVARERMLVLLAGAGRAMKAQDIAAAIGENISDTANGWRTETTRSRLKVLIREGQVVEDPTGWFAIAPATRNDQGGSSIRGAVAARRSLGSGPRQRGYPPCRNPSAWSRRAVGAADQAAVRISSRSLTSLTSRGASSRSPT